jgi:Flp pilus assembly protein TadB
MTRPKRSIRRRAEEIRRQLELATAVFLDLVNVLLAGGAGIETSVIAAANAGDGPGFSIIRLAVMRAQSARLSYWDSLAEVGHIAGTSTLIEVAHTVQLSGQHGARIRASLVSKAVALRNRNLARVEHDHEQRTEKIGLPLILLFLGFLLLVGYPAFSQTLASF